MEERLVKVGVVEVLVLMYHCKTSSRIGLVVVVLIVTLVAVA